MPGKTYQNRATIVTVTSTHKATASTSTGPSGFHAPAGWVSSRGRLFTSGGALSCEGVNEYNDSQLENGTVVVGYSCTHTGTGTWYSYGVSQAWNGSGYTAFYTFKSPNQNS